jgi:hypothetical protein
MRCHKCGYFSFDYLSECRKCGVDLTGTRDKLGLAPVKPSEPFLLGILLKDYKIDAGRTSVISPGAEHIETGLGDLEFGPDVSFDLELAEFEDQGDSAGSFPGQAQVRDHLDSARKVLEDIESVDYAGGAGPEDEMELDLDSVLDAATADDGEERRGGEVQILGAVREDTEIELSMEDTDLFIEDPEPLEPNNGTTRMLAYSSGTRNKSAPESNPEDESPQQTEEDMTIELSSEDLEDLLQELDEASGSAEKKGKDQL